MTLHDYLNNDIFTAMQPHQWQIQLADGYIRPIVGAWGELHYYNADDDIVAVSEEQCHQAELVQVRIERGDIIAVIRLGA